MQPEAARLLWVHVGQLHRLPAGREAFEVVGGRHYSDEEIRNYYPFTNTSRPLTSRVTDFLRRRSPVPTDVFNQSSWESATNQVRQAYANDGYIYSQVAPIVERRVTPDSVHYVDLRWEVEEGAPAVINRIEIVGNDYTTETCIPDQLVILPGDVYNQQRLIQSWQSIGNLGFFETPIPPPEQKRANEEGDIDLLAGNDKVGHELAMAQLSRKGRKPADRAVSR